MSKLQIYSREELRQHTFRANPNFNLVLYDRLPEQQRQLLASLTRDPDFYGVLIATDNQSQSVKSVCCETALLFLTMQESGPLPSYLLGEKSDTSIENIIKMVFDDILEIEYQNNFISGAAAYRLDDQPLPAISTTNATADLSIGALKYAQMLALDDPLHLSLRLYNFNRVPLTLQRQQQLPNREAVRQFIGIGPHDLSTPTITKDWIETPMPPENDAWIMWRARTPKTSQRVTYSEQPNGTYKLYISPIIDELPQVFEIASCVLAQAGASAFKIGNDAINLLRADKIVAYFPTFNALEEAANTLADLLRPYPAQGVPFACQLTDNGMLSWGIDPPKHVQSAIGLEGTSWRLWLTNKLASALITAQSAHSHFTESHFTEPWQYAINRLRLDGVNIDTWSPEPTLWQ